MQFSGHSKKKYSLLLQGREKKPEKEKVGVETKHLSHREWELGGKGTGKAGREKSEEAGECLESANRSFQSTNLRG